uniref:Uncharacterized protein n=1 Tax=Corethron hystrix TaxID=216773 RepID=A0A7S1BPM5_9STRA|mmetsp:Transcript_36477/g.85255  ORF Transcript_36477/g.85255 Transcript_36477/m.85255 type:complete len:169 (+) Transcript_36477:228-734(+)
MNCQSLEEETTVPTQLASPQKKLETTEQACSDAQSEAAKPEKHLETLRAKEEELAESLEATKTQLADHERWIEGLESKMDTARLDLAAVTEDVNGLQSALEATEATTQERDRGRDPAVSALEELQTALDGRGTVQAENTRKQTIMDDEMDERDLVSERPGEKSAGVGA